MCRFHGWMTGVLLLSLSACSTIENRLVYYPSRSEESTLPLPAPWQDVECFTVKDVKIHARWYPNAEATGAILLCGGNTGNLEQRMAFAQKLSETQKESVLLFDYPGFGRSDGDPSEQGCYDAADAAYQWLTKTGKVSENAILLYGETLGAAVAVDLATRKPHRALILVTPFTSFPDVTDYQMPLFPGYYVLNNRFDNIAKMPQCPRPVFFAHGDLDRVIPIRHSQKLFEICTQEKELCILKGQGHLDPLPYEFHTTLRTFLLRKAPIAWPKS